MRVLLRSPPAGLLLVALMATACADAPTTPKDVDIVLSVVGGDGQEWLAGSELPDALVVKVTKKNGKGVRNHLVNFRVIEGGGSVFAGSAETGRHGIAQEYWTLGSEPGENVLEVRSVHPRTGEKQVWARFTATGLAWPEQLGTIQRLIDDAFVHALIGRLEAESEAALLDELSSIRDGLGEEFDFDQVEAALAAALELVQDAGPPNKAEYGFLALILGRADVLFDEAMQAIFD